MKPFLINRAILFAINNIYAQSTDGTPKVKNVALLLYDDVELLDFAGPPKFCNWQDMPKKSL